MTRLLPESGIAVWLVPSEPESALLQQLMARYRHPSPGAPHSFPHFHPHITLASISSGTRVPVAPPTAPPKAAAGGDAPSPGTASTQRDDSGPDPDPVVLLTLREAVPLGQHAIRVRFARVLAGDHYFRSIYVAIAPTPELAQLRAAFAQAKAQVQVQAQGGGEGQKRARAAPAAVGPDDPPAFPHLSLYYVADEEAHARERVLQELEREDVVRHSADGLSVALRCAGEGLGGGEGDGVLEGLTCTQIWIVDCGGPVEGWKVLDKILLAK